MKNTLVTGGIVLVVSLVVALVVASNVTPTVTVNEDSIVAKVVKVVKESLNLGSVVGPEDTFTDRVQNGVYYRTEGARLVAATSTVFKTRTPNATTTPSIFCDVDIASTSATVWTVAISTGGYATTTMLLEESIAASAKGEFGFVSTTTSSIANYPPVEVAPNSDIIVSVMGLISGSDEITGTGAPGANTAGYCSAVHKSFGRY
jgi:hypothetical protein